MIFTFLKWNPEILFMIIFPFWLAAVMLISLVKAIKKVNFINKMKLGEEPKQEIVATVQNIQGMNSPKDSFTWISWYFQAEGENPFFQKTMTFRSENYNIPWGSIKKWFLWKAAKEKLMEKLSDIIRENDTIKIYISPIKPKYYYIEDNDVLSKLKLLK